VRCAQHTPKLSQDEEADEEGATGPGHKDKAN
jgi:hypothetical protein